MIRLHYYRVPQPLPDADLLQVAAYWKRHYNTTLGKGTINQFMRNYRTYVE